VGGARLALRALERRADLLILQGEGCWVSRRVRGRRASPPRSKAVKIGQNRSKSGREAFNKTSRRARSSSSARAAAFRARSSATCRARGADKLVSLWH
jgi:hypothetical protein